MSPFDEGVMAAETGMTREDNPYAKGSADHSDWNAGFDTAIEAKEAGDIDEDSDPT